jgi:hypothetical protein
MMTLDPSPDEKNPGHIGAESQVIRAFVSEMVLGN